MPNTSPLQTTLRATPCSLPTVSPFRYLTEDYGLEYYAAFSGCSAETEASFQTIAFLAQKVDELDLPVVLVLEGGDHSIAQTVAASAGKTICPSRPSTPFSP